MRKQVRDSLAAPAARRFNRIPPNLAWTPRPSNQPPMVAADSYRKSNYRHFPNHLRRIHDSHYQATKAPSQPRESAHIYLEWSRHETSGESTTAINGLFSLGAGASPSQLARATSCRPNRQQRFWTPLREVGSSQECLHEMSGGHRVGTTQRSFALCAHSKGGEAC